MKTADQRSRPDTALFLFALFLSCVLLLGGTAQAQTGVSPDKNTILLTVFFKHDQSKTLGEIRDQLEKHGFYREFPPQGVEVVSWYIMMGIGQVVVLKVPAERLREVNLAIEKTAWGAFRTEFYPTYDYRQVWEEEHNKAQCK